MRCTVSKTSKLVKIYVFLRRFQKNVGIYVYTHTHRHTHMYTHTHTQTHTYMRLHVTNLSRLDRRNYTSAVFNLQYLCCMLLHWKQNLLHGTILYTTRKRKFAQMSVVQYLFTLTCQDYLWDDYNVLSKECRC